ncbi:MAG: hypothetical protein FWB87_04140 [Defluviitaleaceae bacterium]|nr:hypothetical protein [Defluviitaleaceae bacterium]
MKIHNIPLGSLTPKSKIKTKLENGGLHIPDDISRLGKARHHMLVPNTYTLPFRIDMTVKTEFSRTNQITSQMSLYIGEGKLYFNGGHTSCTDIVTKAKASVFGDNRFASMVRYNGIPDKDFVEISAYFTRDMMWVTVDGEICYASNKLDYLTAPQENGINISLCGGTDTKLTLRCFSVTEYENDAPATPEALQSLPILSDFDMFINGIPPRVQDAVRDMDKFLLNEMKPLKFKRGIDKYGHLQYKASCGLLYEMREFGVSNFHMLNWLNAAKSQNNVKIINHIAKTAPDLAERIFANLHECNPHARDCKRRMFAEFNGKSKSVCEGKIKFNMETLAFMDIKAFVKAVLEFLS